MLYVLSEGPRRHPKCIGGRRAQDEASAGRDEVFRARGLAVVVVIGEVAAHLVVGAV